MIVELDNTDVNLRAPDSANGGTHERETTDLTCIKCGATEAVDQTEYENTVSEWEIVTKEPETWQHDYDCAGSVEYNLADLPQRDNALFAHRLKAAFPWLGTDEDAGSGAEVIQALGDLYTYLEDVNAHAPDCDGKCKRIGGMLSCFSDMSRLKPETHQRIQDGIEKHLTPAELKCPNCGSEQIRSIADGLITRDIISYTPKRLLINGQTTHGGMDAESEKNDRLECCECSEEFPIPPGVEADYE